MEWDGVALEDMEAMAVQMSHLAPMGAILGLLEVLEVPGIIFLLRYKVRSYSMAVMVGVQNREEDMERLQKDLGL